MIDTGTRAVLARILAACGITGPDAFQRRYGVHPATLSAAGALTVITWMEHAGTTIVVWVPAAVRAYAAVYGITQRDGESDHDFNDRLRREIRAIQQGGSTDER